MCVFYIDLYMQRKRFTNIQLVKKNLFNTLLEIKYYVIIICYLMQIYIHNKYMIFNLTLYDSWDAFNGWYILSANKIIVHQEHLTRVEHGRNQIPQADCLKEF